MQQNIPICNCSGWSFISMLKYQETKHQTLKLSTKFPYFYEIYMKEKWGELLTQLYWMERALEDPQVSIVK